MSWYPVRFKESLDSAYFFARRFFGLSTENVTFRTVADLDDPVSWITPWKSCPRFSDHQPHQSAQWAAKYVLPIAQRLGKLVPGIEFPVNDTRGALVFSTRELQNLEYEYDLLIGGISGHASRGDPVPSSVLFMSKNSLSVSPMQLVTPEFGHDTSVFLPLSTMGLNKDALPLNPRRAPVHRGSGLQNKCLSAQMWFGKFYVQKVVRRPQVRFALNGATFPPFICETSKADKRYGTCSLDTFARANEHSTTIQYKGESWSATREIDQWLALHPYAQIASVS